MKIILQSTKIVKVQLMDYLYKTTVVYVIMIQQMIVHLIATIFGEEHQNMMIVEYAEVMANLIAIVNVLIQMKMETISMKILTVLEIVMEMLF